MAKGRTAGARELKTHLGAYLRKVREGATVVVTDRGEPVAELRPIGDRGSAASSALTRLLASGAVTRRTVKPLRPFRAIRLRHGTLEEAVLEDREDRI